MNMKMLLLIFLLTSSCNAMAEWVEYFTGKNGDIFYFDDARLQKSGNVVKVWNRVRYKTSVMGASSYESHMKVDCSEYSQTTLQSMFYVDENWSTPAMAPDTNEKSKVYITANSATERLANILCKE